MRWVDIEDIYLANWMRGVCITAVFARVHFRFRGTSHTDAHINPFWAQYLKIREYIHTSSCWCIRLHNTFALWDFSQHSQPVLARNGKRVQFLPWHTLTAHIQTKSLHCTTLPFHFMWPSAMPCGMASATFLRNIAIYYVWNISGGPRSYQTLLFIVFWTYLELQQAPR